MFKTYLQNRKNRKGFSLIELLIVIAIIGIIATIAIPLLLSARNNAINEKARNSLRTVVSAEAAFYAKNGAYGTFAELEAQDFIDGRFATNTLGNSINISAAPAAGDTYTCTIEGATFEYTATEDGEIVETAMP